MIRKGANISSQILILTLQGLREEQGTERVV
jgi:hypothetical protein